MLRKLGLSSSGSTSKASNHVSTALSGGSETEQVGALTMQVHANSLCRERAENEPPRACVPDTSVRLCLLRPRACVQVLHLHPDAHEDGGLSCNDDELLRQQQK